ncbi:hypothetical protein OAQ87_00755 [Candidatus Marinimicrobia bacterium]|nr:hypothetical protein [Candidatus Neomarinimicrobiota bacterium]
MSHALWGKGLFGYRKYGWYALLFGSIPDLLSFGLYFLFKLISNPTNLQMGKPNLETIPYWVFNLYDFSHSIIIAFVFIIITFFINKDLCFPMLAWPFHILLDFFTHSAKFFPTPIFWPIFDYKFDGIPWSNPYIWFFNVFCIILIFIYRKFSIVKN